MHSINLKIPNNLSKFQNLARFIKFCRPEGKNMILLVYIQKE